MMLSKLRFSLPSFFFRSLVAESSVKVDDPFSCPDSEVPSFSELYSLPSIVIDNLREQGLVYPTEIQRKSLDSLLTTASGKNTSCTVINAETGSGKTLCFILPILKLFEELWQRDGSIPAASATVLVPSPHLAQQVNDVFQSLAHSKWNATVAAFHHSSFSFTKDSHLLIANPGKLQHYNLETFFANNKVLCLDEADTLLYGAESSITKEILKTVQASHKLQWRRFSENKLQERSDSMAKETKETSDCGDSNYVAPRVILTAATLPSGGPQTVGKQLLRLFPKDSVSLLKTESAHKTLSNAEIKFIRCSNTLDKFSQLMKDLDELCTHTHNGSELPKVLIFANTMESAQTVSKFLHKPHFSSDDIETPSTSSDIATMSSVSITPASRFPDNLFVDKWWLGKVGCFFKQPGVFKEEREQVLQDFRRGSVRVMVCTDLGSRGLDFLDCTAVIQFDFPENSEFFLHRAGRTARAGRSGMVLSYIGEPDEDIAREIEKVVADRSKSFDSVFSRNKMLRRKLKRRKGRKF